jgi:hypothetical protein
MDIYCHEESSEHGMILWTYRYIIKHCIESIGGGIRPFVSVIISLLGSSP